MKVTEAYIIKGIKSVFELENQIQKYKEQINELENDISTLYTTLIETKTTLRSDMKDKDQIIVQLTKNPGTLYQLTKINPDIEIKKIIIDIKEK